MKEWRDVPGYEGLYQISISTKEGRCRSLNYNKTGKIKDLTNIPNRDGRIKWSLSMYGKSIGHQAARWIAITYPELVQNEYFEGAEIDHIDTDRLNNHPSNLRWVTRKENNNNPLTIEHKIEALKNRTEETKKKMSESNKGKHFYNGNKWVIKLSANNEILHFYPSTKQAERETGINSSGISRCCNGKIKTSGGFFWKYVV